MPHSTVQGWDMAAEAHRRPAITDALPTASAATWAAAAAAALLLLLTAGRVAQTITPDLWFAGRVVVVFAGCAAVLRIAARLATAEADVLTGGALLIGLTWLVSGPALLSGAPLLGGPFAPFQTALVLLLVSLAVMQERVPVAAIAILGLVFDVQPQVALWGLAALAGGSIALWREGAPIGRAWARGGAVAVLLMLPALWWWQHAGGGLADGALAAASSLPQQQDVAWQLPMQGWMALVCTVTLALASFAVIGVEASVACFAFLGILLLFVAGCFLPLLTGDAGILALNPIVADTSLQLLAAAGVAAVVLRDLRGAGGLLRTLLSALAAVSLLLHPLLLPLAMLAMLARAAAAHGELLGFERRIRDIDRHLLGRLALGAILLAGVIGAALR